jgi:hypothetical protein
MMTATSTMAAAKLAQRFGVSASSAPVAGSGTARGDVRPELQGGEFVEVAFEGRILDGAVAGRWPPGPLEPRCAMPVTSPATPSRPHVFDGLGVKALYLIAQEEFARPCDSPRR